MKLIVTGSAHYPRNICFSQLKDMRLWLLEVEVLIPAPENSPAQWASRFGLSMGIPFLHIPRDKNPLDYGTALLAFWDGKSPGTKHMIRIAGERGIPVFVCKPPGAL